MSAAAEASRVDAGPEREDPNYILSQREFHESLDDHFHGVRRVVEREFREAEKTLGWIVGTIALWFLFLGYQLATGKWRA